MNQFDVNSPLKDHVFIRMFSVQVVVHIVYTVHLYTYAMLQGITSGMGLNRTINFEWSGHPVQWRYIHCATAFLEYNCSIRVYLYLDLCAKFE